MVEMFAFVKTKMAFVLVAALWTLSGFSLYKGSHPTNSYAQQYEPPPTVPEMERHLEAHDREIDRIDGPDGKIDRLREEMKEQFKELRDSRSDQHKENQAWKDEISTKVNQIWYGAAAIAGVFGLGVVALKLPKRG